MNKMPNQDTQESNAGLTFLADYGLVVLLAAIFGVSFSLTKIALVDITPWSLVAGRLVVTAIIMALVMMLLGQRLPGLTKIWGVIFASAFFGNVMPFFLISWGQERVDAGLAAILMATMPLMTILLAHWITRDEKLNSYKLFGFCMGLVGVVVLIGIDKLTHLGDETWRNFAIVLAACCYAINAIITKWLVGVPRFSMLAALMLAAVIQVLPLAFIFESPLALSPTTASWISLGLLAIFPTAIGTLLILLIVKRQGASFLSQINFMVPVFGVLWSVFLVNELPPARALVALAIILTGVAIARIGKSSASKLEKIT